MSSLSKHLIHESASVREVLEKLDLLGSDAILFVVTKNDVLISALTDGDIRRGLIRGLDLNSDISSFTQPSPKYFLQSKFNISKMRSWREQDLQIIPVVDDENRIISIINFRLQRSYLPLDAVVMAGGLGSRLRPLTLTTPKPLLPVGDKPILEHNVDRLKSFGVSHVTMTIKYLGEQIIDYFGDGSDKQMSIDYITEDEPLGTIGAVSLIDNFQSDFILVMNSDLLTTIDFEKMFEQMLATDADMIVATVPYEVKIPYGVIETSGEFVTSLKEKPTYTYYSNAGIYMIKKAALSNIPNGKHFNATDLMESLYSNGGKVAHFPIVSYWLDVGKHDDYEKANRDISQLTL